MSYKKALTGLMAMLCLISNGIAQVALSPGDKLPEQVFHSIKAQKGSALLISECNTLCKDCIKVFTTLHRLQKHYKNRLQFIPVVKEDKSALDKYLSRTSQQVLLNIVTADSVVHKYFPYRYVPHNIWVGSDGVIKAITAGELVDTVYLNELLQNSLSLPLKDDFLEFNSKDALIKQDKASFYTAVTGYQPNIKPRYGFDTTDRGVRMYFINYPLVKLYLAVYGHALFFPANRIIIEGANVTDYIYHSTAGRFSSWNQKHSYSYEQLMPLNISRQERLDALIAVLNTYFGINGRMEKRMLSCWVLKCINAELIQKGRGHYINTLAKPTGKVLSNGTVATLVWELDKQSPVPVLDETGITHKINIELSDISLQNVEQLNRVLKNYGLILEKNERMLDVFVLTEKKKSYE